MVQDVMTCFLRREGRILLLRRSQMMRTFRGQWSAVSGSIESDPISQAYQEVREECGYEPEELRLVRTGEPLEVHGEGRHFRVHPILFELLTTRDPQINWETAEWRWVDPEEIEHFDTVPQLAETWQRVAVPSDPVNKSLRPSPGE